MIECGGKDAALGHERAPRHDGSLSDHRVVHDDGADSHQAVIADRAAVHGRLVGDRAEIADQCWVVVGDVDHREILQIGHPPDLDPLALGAQHGVVPDRSVSRDRNRPVELRTGCDPHARVDLRLRARFASAAHWPPLCSKLSRTRRRSSGSHR